MTTVGPFDWNQVDWNPPGHRLRFLGWKVPPNAIAWQCECGVEGFEQDGGAAMVAWLSHQTWWQLRQSEEAD